MSPRSAAGASRWIRIIRYEKNLSVIAARCHLSYRGEALAKPGTFPFRQRLPSIGNGDDRRQWRKQRGAVGAAASRMQATAKQTLGAATRAVARRQALTERFLYSSGAMTLSSIPARWSRVLPSQMLSRVGSTSRQNSSVFWKSFSMAGMQAVSFIQTASSKWW